MIFSIVPGFNPGNWMKFFLGFSQTLFRNLAKACSFYKYCPPAKASANLFKEATPSKKESLKSFVINLHNPNKINK